jgi:hypothetical protein
VSWLIATDILNVSKNSYGLTTARGVEWGYEICHFTPNENTRDAQEQGYRSDRHHCHDRWDDRSSNWIIVCTVAR